MKNNNDEHDHKNALKPNNYVPKISVEMGCYNFEKYISEAIESVLKQTLKPYELIITDDNSSDSSWEIIEEYQKKYPHIIKAYKMDENIGMKRCGIFRKEKMRGELFSTIDGDDRWLPEKLELEWAAITQNLKAKIAYSNVYMIDEKGTRTSVWYDGNGQEPPTGDVFLQVFSKRFWPHNRSLFRSYLTYVDILKEIGYKDLNENLLHPDWDKKIRMTAKYEVAYSGKALVEYRAHKGGIHNLQAEKLYLSTQYVINKNLKLLDKYSAKEKKFVHENLQSMLKQDYEYGQRNRKESHKGKVMNDKTANKGENLIFLISQPRAGSTMMQRVLGSHSDIHTVAEPWIMLHPLYALKQSGIQTEYGANYAQTGLEDFIAGLPSGRQDYLDGLRIMAESWYSKALQKSNKSIFLDKTPRYYNIIPELAELFPKAKIFLLLRNPLAVISSILETWVNSDWDRLTLHRDDILRAPLLLSEALNGLGEKVEVIHYEAFVKNPNIELENLCNKIGVPFEPSMLNYGSNPVPKGRMGDAIGVKKHTKPETDSLEKWKKTFSKPINKMLAEVCLTLLGSEVIKQMGYDYSELLENLVQVPVNEPDADIIEIKKVLSALNLSSKSLDSIDPIIQNYLKINHSFAPSSIPVSNNLIPETGMQNTTTADLQAQEVQFKAVDLSSYHQPEAGNTEKYIGVKPSVSVASPKSSYQALKDYSIRDFGTGLEASLKILGHIVLNKFKKEWAGKNDFWLKTLVLPVRCDLFDVSSGKSFAETKPQSPVTIDPAFAESEKERLVDVQSYAAKIKSGEDLGKALYITGKALNELMQPAKADEKGIYMLDGARRLSASALAHKSSVDILLIMHEEDYATQIPARRFRDLKQKMQSLSWFNNYQNIPLIGLRGERTAGRFSLMNNNLLQGQTIMDFGCNTGQACLKAIQAGAKKVVGVEGMTDTYNLAQDIKALSGFENLDYLNIDFNDKNFGNIIDEQVPEKVDYSFFFSVYRTRELTQREQLFKYIINKTQKGIFFEGHADPKIDSMEYHDWLFDCFGLKYQFLGYSEGNIRPLFYLPLQDKIAHEVRTQKSTNVVEKRTLPSKNVKTELKRRKTDQKPGDEYPFLVSAIVSTYNSEKFIEGKLNDLLNQTLGERLEIIVIDSASPENEKAIVESYQRKHSNIKFVRTGQRETVYEAWTRGIKMAGGKFVTNSNTDDRLRGDALEVMAGYLEQNTDTALVYGNFYITGHDNQTFENHVRSGYSLKPDFNPNIMLHGCHMGPQPLWRKSVHDQLGYFDSKLKAAGDYDMWCRIAAAGYKMKHLPEFLGLYLHNADGIINSNQSLADKEAAFVRANFSNVLPPAAEGLPTGFYYREPVRENDYVNICMVTYNRLEFTKQALQSLMIYTKYPYVITVVDNNSKDGSGEYLQILKDKGVIKNLILLDENVGVAKASNLAWKQEPNAQYYMKYDNDIVIQKEDWLKNMIAVAEGFPQAGMIGYNFEPYSYSLKNEFNLKVRIKQQGNLGGACVIIPKSTESVLGYWCEDYGLYSEEDADYGFRIQLTGLKNIYMEDENIGLHLPAGKAAIIDVNANFDARDGMEEEQDKEYRAWKDRQRSEVVNSGLRDKNFADYQSGQKSLFVESAFFQDWLNGRSSKVDNNEISTSKINPRIGFLTMDHYNYACPMIRLFGPLQHLGQEGEIDFVSLDNKEDTEATFQKIGTLDILVIQRNLPEVLPFKQLIQVLGKNRPKIVYEFDDAFKQLEKGHVAYNYYSSFKDKIDEYLNGADLVTVSTKQLQKYYKKQNANIIVLPNLINENIWKFKDIKESKSDKIRILFAGTPGHEPDLQVTKAALVKLLKEFGDKIELLMWGNALAEFETLENVSSVDAFKLSYHDYATKLQSLDVDLAIVPLANTSFNKAKSHIKWLEYSACGIPSIFSKVGEYPSVIKNKKNGLLVTNTTKAWYDAIKWLINHPAKRMEIATTAQKDVRENHTLQKNAHLWLDVYNDLLGQEITSKSKTPETTNNGVEVSIIIPVYNKIEYTKKCIHAILKNRADTDFEIIVVDNASTDGTADHLKTISAQEKQVKVISNKQNAGFAGANNQAVEQANGDFILFLNNDTEVLPGWLDNMLSVIKNDASVGAVGNKLLYRDGTIQHGGVVIINDKVHNDPLLAQNIFVGQNRDFPDANQMREYQAVTAACLLTSKKYFNQVGGFDESFWNGYEDVDLCFKIREAGLKIVYQPASEVLHFESKSGTERFAKVAENIGLLHSKWLNKISVDFIITEKGDVQQTTNIHIRPYPSDANQKEIKNEISGLVSIIMLTCNALDYTKKCVSSIQKNTKYAHEIIFVDNGSKDGTVKYLETLVEQNSNYKLVKNKTNKGFAAGNNQGVKEAKGEFVFFLNNDVLVADNWLSDMVSALQKDGAIGMVGPLTNSISGLQRLDNVPYSDDAAFDGFAAQIRDGNKGNVTPRRRIAGFAVLMRKDIYADVEGFDESFGLGNFEDDDLCLKVREAGYAIMVHEGTFIHHFGSQSFKANKIDLGKSLDEKGKVFKENWPEVDYEELLEIKNPLHVVHPKMINEATEHLEKGDTESATEIYSKVLDENPLNGEALMGIALALRMEGQSEQAVPFLKAAFNHFPDNILIPNQLGMVAFEMGDLELAKSHFATAIQMNPSFLEAKRNYGQALIDSGDYENGVVAFTKILEKHPDDVISIVYMAGLYKEVGQIEKATVFTEKALEIDPDNQHAIELLENLKSGDIQKTHDLDISSLNEEAYQALGSFQVEQAEKLFQQSFDTEENAEAMFGSALCASQKDLEIKTITILTNLIEKWPGYAPAYNQLGLLKYQNNEFENARDFFATAIEKDNTLLDAQRNYGLSLIELSDFQNGIAVFNKILKNHPDDVETLVILAGFYCEIEKWNEADNFITAALNKEPDNTNALELQTLINNHLEVV